MTYSEALAYVAALENRGWRLGLDRMEEFVRRAGLGHAIGRPDLVEPGQSRTGIGCVRGTPLKFIHVAGTNGKGSVTAYLQFLLREAGHRVGGFFSPFVYDIRERIQLDCEMISEEDFTRLVERLKPVAESLERTELGGVTEFEFKTAMGFAFWEEKCCDWVALEVGLGGRLDATNVVTPACSVITSIGMDHTEFLGETLEAIAGEKAGIFKPGVPAVVGELPSEAQETVEARAEALGCPLWTFGRDFGVEPEDYDPEGFSVRLPSRTFEDLRSPLLGVHQPHNVALALAALEAVEVQLEEGQIRAGLASVRLPGRMERRAIGGREIWMDGAHNAESMGALMMTLLTHRIKRPVVVFGMLTGHEPEAVCSLLDNFADEVHLCPIDFRRSADPKDLARHFRVSGRPRIHPDAPAAIRAALESRSHRPILVTGSFYLVGEVGRYLSGLQVG